MLDTNILLSAILFPGERMNATLRKASVNNQLVLSSYVLEELFDVIHRKFPDKEMAADSFLHRIPYELVYTPKQPEAGLFSIRDPDDYAVLYSAMMNDVDIFVTDDKDFGDVALERPRIMTPARFLTL